MVMSMVSNICIPRITLTYLPYKLKLNSHADHARAKQQRKQGGGTMMVGGMIAGGLLLCIAFSEIDSGNAMYSRDNPPCQK